MSEHSAPARAPLRHLPLIAIALVALAGAFFLRDRLDFATLEAHREELIAYRDAHYVLAVLGFILAYVAMVAFSVPGALVATMTGGFLFGIWPGVLINVAAATMGATLIFLAARWGLGDWLAARMAASEGMVQRLKLAIDRNQWSALFLLRLLPVVPFFLGNLLPALVGVPLRRFLISTAIGIVPGTSVYTSLGAGLGDVFAAGQSADMGVIFEPHILFPLLGLCVLAVLPILLRPFTKDKGI